MLINGSIGMALSMRLENERPFGSLCGSRIHHTVYPLATISSMPRVAGNNGLTRQCMLSSTTLVGNIQCWCYLCWQITHFCLNILYYIHYTIICYTYNMYNIQNVPMFNRNKLIAFYFLLSVIWQVLTIWTLERKRTCYSPCALIPSVLS